MTETSDDPDNQKSQPTRNESQAYCSTSKLNADHRNINEITLEFDSKDSVVLRNVSIFGSEFEVAQQFKCFAMNSKLLTEKLKFIEKNPEEDKNPSLQNKPSNPVEFKNNMAFLKNQTSQLFKKKENTCTFSSYCLRSKGSDETSIDSNSETQFVFKAARKETWL